MKDCVRAAFLPFTNRFEGHCTWLYLDEEGLVTTGYGNLVDPHIPALLDMRDRAGNKASLGQIQVEWRRVKALQAMKKAGGGWFHKDATLFATEASILALVHAEVESFWATLLHYFPDAEDWPADAQLGILSMAWADGPGFPDPKNPVGYPKFSAAARARDWLTCADECHIDERNNPGVVPRNIANKSLFTCAAYTLQPDRLSQED